MILHTCLGQINFQISKDKGELGLTAVITTLLCLPFEIYTFTDIVLK